jgi:hypothetical protein
MADEIRRLAHGWHAKYHWSEGEFGQEFYVRILTRTNRILAAVTVQVPLRPEFPLEERMGQPGLEEIVGRSIEIALMVAEAVELRDQPH